MHESVPELFIDGGFRAASLDASFSGIKASGLGREMGPEAIVSYQTIKSIFRFGVPTVSVASDTQIVDGQKEMHDAHQ